MIPTTENPERSVSLDNMFTPPSREQWLERVVAGLGGEKSDIAALQQLRRTTLEGIPLEVLYDSIDIPLNLALDDQPAERWDNRLSVNTHDASQASDKILQGLQGGITSIELHPQTPADIPTALSGVQLELATISLRTEHQYAACVQALLKVADERGLDKQTWHCSLNADPVNTALVTGTTEADIPNELITMVNFTMATAKTLPSAKCILVDVALHHNAGASTVEELHAALATATLYLEALLEGGMSLHDACGQIIFQIAMDADVLLGVAKLRALRGLWQLVVAQFSSDKTHPIPATIVAETSHRFLSAREPWNNHLRNLCASTAAMLGGANTLLVHPHDALQRVDKNFDTSLGDRMARNMAIILERESGLGKVHDPMAGSYAIENLTRQLMEHTWQSLASTDTGEGWIDELLSGRWQTRLNYTHQQRITLMQQEQRIAVGVNRFVLSDTAVPQHLNEKAMQILTAVREARAFEHTAEQELTP